MRDRCVLEEKGGGATLSLDCKGDGLGSAALYTGFL